MSQCPSAPVSSAPRAGPAPRPPAPPRAPRRPRPTLRAPRARLEAMPTPSSAADHIQDLGAYVSASPSSFHAVHEAARRLDAAGFTGLDELQPWNSVTPGSTAGAPATADGKFYVIRDGAIIAWVVPTGAGPTTGFNILGAHTDSPSFKLKPKPTTGRFGWLQAGVEVYGGPLLNSWLDRELQLAGRLVMRDGTQHLTATGPLAALPAARHPP